MNTQTASSVIIGFFIIAILLVSIIFTISNVRECSKIEGQSTSYCLQLLT